MYWMPLFIPKKNTSSQLSFFFLNGEALFREQTVKYLGVHFSPNMTWSTHIYTVFVKCLKLPFLFADSVLRTSISPFYDVSFQNNQYIINSIPLGNTILHSWTAWIFYRFVTMTHNFLGGSHLEVKVKPSSFGGEVAYLDSVRDLRKVRMILLNPANCLKRRGLDDGRNSV